MKTKDELPDCPVATAVSLIGGKWKLLILRNLKNIHENLMNCREIWKEYLKKCLQTA